jgi:hypothetical protein
MFKMDLTPSPFRIRSKQQQQTFVFNFNDVGSDRYGEDPDDETSEVLIGEKTGNDSSGV